MRLDLKCTFRELKYLGAFAALALVLVTGLPAPAAAAAPQAVLYEFVENLDEVVLFTTGVRESHWTAQGTAEHDTALCPFPTTCTITAFGMDSINLSTGSGTVWANIAVVANDDNVVDGPEGVRFTGQVTGNITIFPMVTPHLHKHRVAFGPALYILHGTDGKFFPDAIPTIRTSPPSPLPTDGATANLTSTFRLPFQVAKNGAHVKPERGKNAFYLADDGSLIKVDKQTEFALGFALLRAEIFVVE